MAVSILFFTTNTLADITIKNKGTYLINKICIGDFGDNENCEDVLLPHGQSYKIPSSEIPPEGVQIAMKIFCAIHLMLPVVEVQGLSDRFIQDDERIDMSGLCIYVDEDNGPNIMPYSRNAIFHWDVLFNGYLTILDNQQ
ncbi:MAG: hypothetical protein KAG53_02970 [Endozoicomonadaceae bacterium]|nr:hypothetical protein [Endozoicomonadaceae bacterium]